MTLSQTPFVTPAKVGRPLLCGVEKCDWFPAFAGMTVVSK